MTDGSGLTDLDVYRYGGRAVLEGLPLYDGADPLTGLPFTYPPFAALLMAPVAALPGWLAAALWTAASVAALTAVVRLAVRSTWRTAGPWADAWWVVPAVTAGALALEPVWQHLALGQVNLLLMLAVLVDLQRPDRRWSGVLVGVAAGVKLTPLVFVVLLVLVGRRAAAGRAAATFAGTVVLGLAVLPAAATSYWTDALVDPGRVGGPAFATNQSAYGVLVRLLDGPPPTVLWLAVAGPLALAVVGTGAAWWRRGDRLLGTCLAGLAMLIGSPISWSHHWVWAVPLAIALAVRAPVLAAGWTALFASGCVWWPPHRDLREFGWSPLEHVVGDAYVIAALVVAWWAAWRLRASAHGESGRSAPGSMWEEVVAPSNGRHDNHSAPTLRGTGRDRPRADQVVRRPHRRRPPRPGRATG